MTLKPSQIDAYLKRIGLSTAPPATIAGLHLLQDHHMRHVPFENLNVLLGRPIDLSPGALFDKIVMQGRGGYCFEVNTLFAELLRATGFEPVPMMARVWLGDPVDVPPRTHISHRVAIGGLDWVTDVGFGGRAARVPLRLEDAIPVEDGDGHVRIIRDPIFGYRVQREIDGVWTQQYSFHPARAYPLDVSMGNHWTEHHESSKFRKSLGVGLFTEVGRRSFYGGVLRRRGENFEPRNVRGLTQTLDVLETDFGLALTLTQAERTRLAQFVESDRAPR